MNGNGGNDKKTERRFLPNSHRSPSPFKSFFIRMGSTGMLNSSAKNRRSSQNLDDKLERTPEKESLFRSCSTSQLNTSPTYVKGDDPSEGIDLRINTKNEHGKTVSCDNLSNNRHKSEDAFDETLTSATTPSGTFTSCDFTDPANRGGDFMRKSSSCDFKEAKKTNFPYAFLRSKLSVLPEEKNYGNSGASGAFNSPTLGKEERLFKTASEEHFPALKIEDSFTGTTTLGRRRSKNGSYLSRDSVRYRLQDPTSRSARNSYSEYKESYDQRDSGSRYFGPMSLSLMHSGFDENHRNSISLPYQASDILDYRPPPIENAAPLNLDLSYESSSTCSAGNGPATTLPMTSAQLRQQRRNSAPSGEQRLSSHYVSSNESGYDSDGPRGESAASETEALSLKCTDSSDTSSVVDSELEKPMRSSTPSECQHEMDTLLKDKSNLYQDERLLGDGIDAGLRWHQQSGSGRVLPSIHQTSSDSPSSSCSPASSASSSSNSIALSKGMEQALGIQSAAHRVRLQQDKTRFLSDIIQPPKRTRRCRLVQLSKASAKESLGIRLAQQRVGEMRYVIVQLESDGIAQRDGRLRLGDEVVEVEGKDLRNFNSLEEVQDFLRSCEGHSVLLKTAYEETMPQLYSVETPDCDYVDSASLADCSSLTICSSTLPYNLDDKSQKRPDFLPLDSTNNVEGVPSISSSTPMTTSTGTNTLPPQQQYTARKHVARFEKGNGKPSLGFSVVGGVDSPRGEMGIFVRRVFPGGQADVSKSLFQGDEILSLNGKVLRGCTHQEVIELFKGVREGPVELELVRRHRCDIFRYSI
ncbi:hypothetical protein QAD02_015498 [Eretmocerus hayati]|uniref:Uncharacterized protein n=1 Tax=Eretmocerus hayati TaxID=131215 RepID=A0ACC2P9P4_9HYME|nr:hypothetical protein QAD02_015498 [Eretmocerus hayati]